VHLHRLNEALEEKAGSSADMADGRLFLGKHGKWGRLIENFHLKLRLFADCMQEVRAFHRADAAAAAEHYRRRVSRWTLAGGGAGHMRCRSCGRPGRGWSIREMR